MVDAKELVDPCKLLPKEHGRPDKKSFGDDKASYAAASAAWRVVRQAELQAARDTQMYKDMSVQYSMFRDLQSKLIGHLFSRNAVRARASWLFDGSIVSDGVSIGLQFSKTVERTEEGVSKAKKRTEKQVEDYDRDLSSVIPGTTGMVCDAMVVLGNASLRRPSRTTSTPRTGPSIPRHGARTRRRLAEKDGQRAGRSRGSSTTQRAALRP